MDGAEIRLNRRGIKKILRAKKPQRKHKQNLLFRLSQPIHRKNSRDRMKISPLHSRVLSFSIQKHNHTLPQPKMPLTPTQIKINYEATSILSMFIYLVCETYWAKHTTICTCSFIGLFSIFFFVKSDANYFALAEFMSPWKRCKVDVNYSKGISMFVSSLTAWLAFPTTLHFV